MFGVNGEYNIVEGVSMFTNSNISVLYGEVNYKVVTTVTANTSGTTNFSDD
jgi:hypothetical protein